VNDDERKELFVALLIQLLADCDGVKLKLAEKLGVKPSTLTPWFQGKVDPAIIDLIFFVRIAEAANSSTDELVKRLGILEKSEATILDKFKNLVRDLLSTQTQTILAKKLGVSESAVGTWVRKKRAIDPRRISIATIAAIAREKNWTIERLLIYLDLKEITERDNLSSKLKTEATVLSLPEQVDLLAWLSNLVTGRLKESADLLVITPQSNQHLKRNDRTICLLLEQEDNAIAFRYTADFIIHLQLNPDKISIATISNLPESLEDFDTLIFDISSSNSEAIDLIQQISFNTDIVIFASEDLSQKDRSRLENKITEILVKPINWQELKNKNYYFLGNFLRSMLLLKKPQLLVLRLFFILLLRQMGW